MLLVCYLPNFFRYILFQRIPILSYSYTTKSSVYRVKVTAKKAGKKVSKSLKATITVKNPALTLKAADVVAVGATEQITATVKPAGTKVTYTTSDATIATVDEKGVVTGVKDGEVTITAKAGKTTKTVKMTVKKYVVKSVKQTKANTLEATIIGKTSDLKASDVKITNKTTNVAFAVKSVAVDANDATKVTIETYAGMTDGKVYAVDIAGNTQDVTVTDGVIKDVAVTPLTIPANATGTEIKAQLIDKDGIVVDEAAYGSTLKNTEFSITGGYFSGNKLVLTTVGSTAKAKITYHGSYTYNVDGTEKDVITKEFTITAVKEDAATLSNFKYTITKDTNAVNWDKVTTTNNKFSVSDKNVYAHFNFVDSNKTDVTKNYSVVSADSSVLLLDTQSLNDKYVKVVGVKAGSTYINVVKDGKVVTSLPVVVTADRKLTGVQLGTTTLTVSSTVNDLNAVSTTIKGLDQYSEEATPAIKEVKVLTGDDTGKVGGAITAAISDKKITFTVENTVKAGTYQVKVVFKSSEISGEVTVVATLNVVDTSKVADSDATFMLELPTDAIDLAIAPGTKAADLENKKINISVVEYKLGAKVSTLEGATITIKNPKGTEVGNGTKLYTVNGNNIIKNITELGTYTVEAKAIVKDAKGNDVEKKFSGSFTVKDTQLSASASIKKTSDIAANGSDAAALAKNVLEQSEVAEFTFDGKKIANATISNATAKVNGKALYIEKAYVTVTDATTGATYDVPVAINASFTLK